MPQISQLQLGSKHGSSPWRSTRSRWLSLLPAAAVSLLVHAVLLLALDLPRAAQAPRTALVVTLYPSTVERPAAAPPVPPRPVRAPEPAPPPAAARPPEPAPPPALSPPATATPPEREVAAIRPAATFQRPEELSRAPLPQGNPDLGELTGRLVGRRLSVSVWVDPLGTVRNAEVAANELTREQVELLERAIAQVQFVPARDRDDAAAAAILRTLLCFDDAGRLEASSDECWKPQPAQER